MTSSTSPSHATLPYDILGPLEDPALGQNSTIEWLFYILLLLLGVGMLVFIFKKTKFKIRKPFRRSSKEPSILSHSFWEDFWLTYNRERNQSNRYGSMYNQVRRLMTESYGFPVLEMTSEEITETLKRSYFQVALTISEKEALCDFIKRADQVRFGNFKFSEEQEKQDQAFLKDWCFRILNDETPRVGTPAQGNGNR